MQETYDLSQFRRTETCPDCIARDDVDLLGRPRRSRQHRIRDCVGCMGPSGRGTARAPRERTIEVQPWWVAGR